MCIKRYWYTLQNGHVITKCWRVCKTYIYKIITSVGKHLWDYKKCCEFTNLFTRLLGLFYKYVGICKILVFTNICQYKCKRKKFLLFTKCCTWKKTIFHKTFYTFLFVFMFKSKAVLEYLVQIYILLLPTGELT